jgi:membrane-associated protease RseP (regulator of RpoE activity)
MTTVSVFLELFVVLTVHELGHWLVAYALRMPVSSMTVGVGPVLFERLWNGMWFRFRLLPISGTVALCWRSKRPWRNVAVYAAGPAANVLLAGALFWTELGAMSAIMAVLNLVPWRLGKMDSDGSQVLREIRQWA